MSDVKHLVFAIVKFLKEEANSNLPEDAAESVGVAAECLETAYGISIDEDATTYPLPESLQSIFFSHIKNSHPLPQPSESDIQEAESMKQKGNDMMKSEKYREAIECYSKAIELNRANAVYYCNRAAAYSKVSDHQAAVDDCDRALHIDPKYSKAFGRKGIAYGLMNKHREAKECYEHALQLDPNNESYKNNLEIASEKLKDASTKANGDQGLSGAPPGGIPGMPGGLNLGGLDFSSFLQNPALVNMATQMMSNPQMQNVMANMMSGQAGQPGGEAGIANLLQAGQQLAEQVRQENPELVDQLRRQAQQKPDDQDDDSKK